MSETAENDAAPLVEQEQQEAVEPTPADPEASEEEKPQDEAEETAPVSEQITDAVVEEEAEPMLVDGQITDAVTTTNEVEAPPEEASPPEPEEDDKQGEPEPQQSSSEAPEETTPAVTETEQVETQPAGKDEDGDEPKPKPTAAEPPSDTMRKKVSTADPADTIEIMVEKKGIGSVKPVTLSQMFAKTVGQYPDHPGLRYKQDGVWMTVTYKQYYANCINTAKSFLKLGLEPKHAVSIIGFNSPEWLYSNMGAIFAGGLAAGIYATNSAEACHFIANHSRTNIIVVENQKQLDKILEVRDRLPHLKAIVQYKGKLSHEYENTYDWEQFMELGKEVGDSEIETIVNNQKPEESALLVYTSGTTGNPKGVMLSHDNLTWTACALYNTTSNHLSMGCEHAVTYLPLSHIAAQVADVYLPIYMAATVSFAQPDALKGSLLQTLQEVQPTYFFGVPRVWEKFQARLQAVGATVTGVKRVIADWAKAKGLQGNRNLQNKTSMPWGWFLANQIAFKKIRQALGLTRCKFFITGAAPIHVSVLEYFMSINIPILELFGMSECTGPHCSNLYENWRLGSVGTRMQGVYTKIAEPNEEGNGELCLRGRHVFMGYMFEEEKTKSAIDPEGWLHTGDVARIDEDGFIFITGRIKEILITAGGENLAPVPIEDRIKEAAPFLGNVMLIGDKRKFISCLVTIQCEIDADSGEPTDKLTPLAKRSLEAIGCHANSVSEIVQGKDEAAMRAIQAALDKANKSAPSNAQKVQKFTLLEKDFSVPGGELGPTLKTRRPIVVKKYAELIENMYPAD